MSVDPIRRRYGYGAAQLCLSPEPHRRREPSPRAAVFEAVQDAGGALLLGLLVFAIVQSLLERDRADRDAVTIVPFETAERTPEPIPEPEPVPVIPPEPTPEPAPAPIAEVAMAPLPSPSPETPTPPSSRRAPARSKPASRLPPRAEIEPIAAVLEAKPEPARPERALPPSALKAAAAPSLRIDAVASSPLPEPTTAPARFRTAKVESRRRPVTPAVSVRIDSPRSASVPALAAPAAPAPRRAAPAPRARADHGKPRLDLPAAATPDLERAPGTDTSFRSATPAPRPALRASAKIAAALDVPALRSDAPRAAPKESARAATHAPASPREAGVPRKPERSLRGVPLGSLAACVSDRREDALKKAVIATVRNREECVSAAGRYRLIETKNLNAFLMWVERAPHRGEADRCAELELALQCLRRSE